VKERVKFTRLKSLDTVRKRCSALLVLFEAKMSLFVEHTYVFSIGNEVLILTFSLKFIVIIIIIVINMFMKA
jgi:hypothetical protein